MLLHSFTNNTSRLAPLNFCGWSAEKNSMYESFEKVYVNDDLFHLLASYIPTMSIILRKSRMAPLRKCGMVSDTTDISHFGFCTAYVISIGIMLNVLESSPPPPKQWGLNRGRCTTANDAHTLPQFTYLDLGCCLL
jgi:hypothetical protein